MPTSRAGAALVIVMLSSLVIQSEIPADQCGIILIHGGWRVIERCQSVGFDVSDGPGSIYSAKRGKIVLLELLGSK